MKYKLKIKGLSHKIEKIITTKMTQNNSVFVFPHDYFSVVIYKYISASGILYSINISLNSIFVFVYNIILIQKVFLIFRNIFWIRIILLPRRCVPVIWPSDDFSWWDLDNKIKKINYAICSFTQKVCLWRQESMKRKELCRDILTNSDSFQ